jgi:hypothetical protein
MRDLGDLDTAPEFLLSGEQEVLIERISWDAHFDPFTPAGDDRQNRAPRSRDPHIVLQLGHVLFGRRFFRKGPRQHELGLEHRPGRFDHPV